MFETSLAEEINSIYSPLDVAVSELFKNREDAELRLKLQKDLNFPKRMHGLFNNPCLVMFRHLATPSNEFDRVANIARVNKLRLMVIEYQEDLFTPSVNPDKYTLGRLPIYNGQNSKNEKIIHNINIVDFARMEGRPISNVLTRNKDKLTDVHHSLLKDSMGFQVNENVVDGSPWLLKFGGPQHYYRELFKLFIADAILLEIYHTSGIEEYFSKEIIIPAFKHVSESTGKRPLIVNHMSGVPKENLGFWDCYPKHVGELLNQMGYH